MSFRIKYSDSNLSKNIDKMSEKTGALVLMYASTKAAQIESQMKADRPWRDRTNMAKATLNTKVSMPSPTIVRITLAHGVDYGIWLELAREKKYAIIAPTIRKESPKVITDMSNLMSKIKL